MLNPDRIFRFFKKNKINFKNIGGYYPCNYEIDDLELLNFFRNKRANISLPIISKNNQMDLSAYVDYSPREYKMQLYSNGQPELDPYRDPLIDYSRDVRVSPLDYKTKDMYGLLSGLKLFK